jgi:hypothetical protein
MKKVLLTILIAVLVITFEQTQAQIELPSPSPTATFSQKVGLTDVEIVYSRPGVKDRKIFGGLVQYGELWRTGANSATKITFSDKVKIGGMALDAGSYALFTIPGEEEWVVIFNTRANQSGTGQYKREEDAIRLNIKPIMHGHIHETFTISIDDVRNTSATINLIWENTQVKIPLEVEVDERVMAAIDRALNVNPNDYYQAALYYRDSGRDLNQALDWMNKAMDAREKQGGAPFWMHRQKALLLADMKKYDDAISAATTSLDLAKKANNMDYVRMNEASIADWKKMK